MSNFNNVNAHMGCYQASKFQILEQEDCTPVPDEQKVNTFDKDELIERGGGQFSFF